MPRGHLLASNPEIGAPSLSDHIGIRVAPVAACRGFDIITSMLRNYVQKVATLETTLPFEEANICVKREDSLQCAL